MSTDGGFRGGSSSARFRYRLGFAIYIHDGVGMVAVQRAAGEEYICMYLKCL